MGISSRFTVAIHILAILAIEKKDHRTTSEYLARSAGTNPVVIRRLLSPLHKAGLVSTQAGAGGGVSLARTPEQITLLAVYRAVEGGEPFIYGARKDNPYCICNRNLEPVLRQVFAEVKTAMENVLAATTLAQIAQEIESFDTQGNWTQALNTDR